MEDSFKIVKGMPRATRQVSQTWYMIFSTGIALAQNFAQKNALILWNNEIIQAHTGSITRADTLTRAKMG